MDANEEMFADSSHPDADTDASCLNTDFGIAGFCVRIMSFTYLHIRLRSCAHILQFKNN